MVVAISLLSLYSRYSVASFGVDESRDWGESQDKRWGGLITTVWLDSAPLRSRLDYSSGTKVLAISSTSL